MRCNWVFINIYIYIHAYTFTWYEILECELKIVRIVDKSSVSTVIKFFGCFTYWNLIIVSCQSTICVCVWEFLGMVDGKGIQNVCISCESLNKLELKITRTRTHQSISIRHMHFIPFYCHTSNDKRQNSIEWKFKIPCETIAHKKWRSRRTYTHSTMYNVLGSTMQSQPTRL